jgi:ATP phosphoribosyltransferase regulatory subunit
MRNWLLPEYIEDVLPEEARRVEALRRAMLDLFAAHGYQLVIPPLLEYVDSLLTGTGRDLDLRTFKLVDQLSGRMLGLRADITPQVARIDAHLLNRAGVSRLCYAGSVLHTQPSALNRTREVLQAGAEIYGHGGVESDVEVQRLMIDALHLAGIRQVHLDIGHVGVFQAILRRAETDAEAEAELFRAVQAKDAPALRTLVKPFGKEVRRALEVLPALSGPPPVLARAARELPAYPEIREALAQMRHIVPLLAGSGADLFFDLGELRGYRYHSGMVFAAYAADCSSALALGGRYDEVGKAFGRARPATGFSLDLREVAAAGAPSASPRAVRAPYLPGNADLQKRIGALRKAGHVVIVDLPGHAKSRAELACDRCLVLREGKWVVVKPDANRRESSRRT